MNYRRSIAAVGLAGVLALAAACGSEDQVTVPAAQPRVVAPSPEAAYEHYYDVTHPAPKVWLNGDAKDHPGYGQLESKPAIVSGDAKDHPNFGNRAGGQIRYSLKATASPKNFREAFQAELTELAAREGLTGLSPAFLQDVDAGGSNSDIWSTPR
jgi:hypothetical protein